MAEIKKLVEDLIYALEEGDIEFSERDTEFINSMESWRAEKKNFTPRQARAAEVVWDKRLKGLGDYTKWDENGAVLFDGKLYQEILEKLAALYSALTDDYVFTEWEEGFISDLYTKYHPDQYPDKLANDAFNPILSGKQIEHLERIHEKELGS
jgi:hypothetical protein